MIVINRIFIGMIFLFLDFNLDFNGSRIGLLPDFIGYIFILRGLNELAGFSSCFVKVMPHVKVMAVYAAVIYAMSLFGVYIDASLGLLLGFVTMLLALFISYNIVMGVKDIEADSGQSLNSGQLYSAWRLLAIFQVLTFVLLYIQTLTTLCILAVLIAQIYYLYVFNITKRLFYEQNPLL